MDAEGIRQQAQDENTAPEILAELANSKDYLTRQYVASNPNTPIETLENLGEEFPDEIVANPIFDLLQLENSESKFIKSILLSLAKSPKTSVEKLSELANYRDTKIREAVAKNKNISLEIMAFLAKEYTNSAYQPPKKARPSDIIINPGDLIRVAIARRDDITESIAKILSQDNSNYVRRHLAMNSNISFKTIDLLSQDSDYYVRVGVAKNINTPSEILKKLAIDCHVKVRKAVTQNHNTPLDIIKKLANDANKIVRAAAKDNLENKHNHESANS